MANSRIIGLLQNADQKMSLELREARAAYDHFGVRGDAVEAATRQFLRNYTRNDVGTGTIIDTDGNVSTQTDIVIVSRDHPLTFRHDSAGLFFIEGVRAAGEVKSVLTKGMLLGTKHDKGILEKSSIYKRLTAVFEQSGSNAPRKVYSLGLAYDLHPPWFLVAFESRISLENIRQAIIDYQHNHDLPSHGILDAIFILNKGWIINERGLQPPSITRDANWKVCSCDTVLSHMLAWLSSVMPRNLKERPILNWYIDPFTEG